LTDTLAHDPTQASGVVRLVEILIDSGWHAQALELITNNISDGVNPYVLFLRGICLEALGNFHFAEDIADQLIAQDRQKANALVIKARIALDSQKNDLAERLFQEAIACDSGCGMAWHGLACLRRQQADAQAGFEFARKAFLCSPASREIAIAFHEGSVIVDKLSQAEAALHEVLSGCPMNRRLRFFLIDLLLRQGKVVEAMAEIESALVDFGVEEGIIAAALAIRKQLGPMVVTANPTPGGSVSLCIIVKNEKNHLARCLRSVKPVVDEIILVDTGSSDETKDIARVFGAQVYDFLWVDDFSKARNFSLSKASGDWILVLDADETVSNKDHEKLKRALETTQSRPAAFRIQTRNYSNHANTVGFRTNQGEFSEEEGIGWFPSEKVRIFTKDPRIRFDYPVHELVEPSLQRLKIPIRDCSVAVHHYGTLQDLHTLIKTKRYGEIGRKKLKKNLKNTAALKELAIQSARIGNHTEALDLWKRFVALLPRSAEAYLNMGTACWNLGRYAEAFSFAEKALRLDPLLKEAKFNLAYSLLLMGRGAEAKKALEEVLKAQPDYLAAQFLSCVAYACLQETAQAESIFRDLKALAIGEYIGESFLDIAKRFLSADCLDYARCTLETALAFGCGNQETRALLENCNVAA
jgi:tetratricopeptide (TPR) repeat protein